MTKIFTKILPLALLLTAAPSLKANSVETTVTFALKFSFNPSVEFTETPTSSFRLSKVVSVKNADFIAYFNEANSGKEFFPFPSTAKIVRVEYFSSESEREETKYFLRHKNGDQADITSSFDWDMIANISNVKYSKKTELGVAKDLRSDELLFVVNPADNGSVAIEGTTVGTYNYKDVNVKGTDSNVSVLTTSQTLNSIARFKIPDAKVGIALGTIKTSGPKIIPVSPAK